jgi:hypothetical protein
MAGTEIVLGGCKRARSGENELGLLALALPGDQSYADAKIAFSGDLKLFEESHSKRSHPLLLQLSDRLCVYSVACASQ